MILLDTAWILHPTKGRKLAFAMKKKAEVKTLVVKLEAVGFLCVSFDVSEYINPCANHNGDGVAVELNFSHVKIHIRVEYV